MSASATPIPPERFAEAILDLPLSNLHFKAAEIRNSISHLDSSNAQLRQFADEDDGDCVEAIAENEETMMRMEERVRLLRREVERRGFQWGEDDVVVGGLRGADGRARRINGGDKEGEMVETGEVETSLRPRTDGSSAAAERRPGSTTGGTMRDAELTTRPGERMDEEEEEEERGAGAGIRL